MAARSFSGEIVISDNGNTERSIKIAECFGARVFRCAIDGYGNALRWGIVGSRGRFVIMGDANRAYDFKERLPMVERLNEGFDLCMGSRFKGRFNHRGHCENDINRARGTQK